MISSLTITIQVGRDQAGYPVTADMRITGQRPQRAEGSLQLDRAALLALEADPATYGATLGAALFREGVRDRLVAALSATASGLRILLTVEDPALRALRWNWLRAPIDGGMRPLAGHPGLIYAGYVPTYATNHYPPIGRRDLRALVAISSPRHLGGYGFNPFDTSAVVGSARAGIGSMPTTILEQASLPEIIRALSEGTFPILHLVCHGRRNDGAPTIYLGRHDDPDTVAPISSTALIEALSPLLERGQLPYLIFLAACDSAVSDTGLDGLAQELVRRLGIPAVIAMTGRISTKSVTDLSRIFYPRFREHGQADRALSEALLTLADRPDANLPVCLTCDPDRPIISTALDRPLSSTEIAHGIEILEREAPLRAPTLLAELQRLGTIMQRYSGVQPDHLEATARTQHEGALRALNTICAEITDLSFHAVANDEPLPAYDARCPFPGMKAFTTAEMPFFFGREALVTSQAERLYAAIVAGEAPILAVGGSSGAGKSSLAVGISTALCEQIPGLQIRLCRPGAEPLAALERALRADQSLQLGMEGAVSGRASAFPTHLWPDRSAVPALGASAADPMLLIVDQGEELFTLCDDEQHRRDFALALCNVGCPIIITFRDDYRSDFRRYPPLASWFSSEWMLLIDSLDSRELRDVVERQANAAGLRLEAGLGARIVEEVEADRAPMPLLQHALRALWDRRRGRWLRMAEYAELGGLNEAIACTADKIYLHSSPSEQLLIEHIIIELVSFDPLREHRDNLRLARRRVTRAELLIRVPGSAEVIGRLDEARLIVEHDGNYELAHEALLRAWPRIRPWVFARIEQREHRDQIAVDVAGWLQRGRQTADLYRGVRLVAALELQTASSLMPDEVAFIRASQRAARQSMVWLLAFAILVSGLALAAVGFGLESRRQTERAITFAYTASARAALIEGNNGRAIALALAAADEGKASPELESILATAAYAPGVSRQIELSGGQIVSAALSPDGRTAIAARGDGSVLQWDMITGDTLPSITVGGGPALAITWVGNRRLLTGGDDGALRLWDLQSGELVRVMRGHRDRIAAIAVLPVSGRVLSASDDNSLRLWHLGHGQELMQLRGHRLGIRALTVSADETLALSAGDDGVRLWDLTRGRELWHKRRSGIADVALAVNGRRREALAAVDNAIVRWDVDDGTLIGVISSDDSAIAKLAVSPTGAKLAVGSVDGGVVLWSLADSAVYLNLQNREQLHFSSLSFGPDEKTLLSAGSNRPILQIWDLVAHPEISPTTLVEAAALALYDNAALFLGNDGSVGHLEPLSGDVQTLQQVSVENPSLANIRVVNDRALIYAVGGDRRAHIAVISLVDGSPLWQEALQKGQATSADLAPSGDLVCIGGLDGIRIVRISDNATIATLPGYSVVSLAFGPGASTLAVSTFAGDVLLLDAYTQHQHWRTTGQSAEHATNLAFGPAGNLLALGGSNGVVRIVDARDGSEKLRLTGHAGAVTALAFDAAGRLLATGSTDRTIRVWDVAAGTELRQFVGSLDTVRALAFAPGSSTLVSAAYGEPLRRWRIDSFDQLAAWAREHRHLPELTCAERVALGRRPPGC